MIMFKADTVKIFESVQCTERYCEDCQYLCKAVEEYEIWGCKEREVEINCTGNHLECQQVDDVAQDVEDFIADNTDMFNLIKEDV